MLFPVNGDPYRDNVALHLPMTGANNSTTFIDVSPTPKTITRYGNTKILTAQSKWGQGSVYFDGTGDNLEVEDVSGLHFSTSASTAQKGAADFCLEFWFYYNAGLSFCFQHGASGSGTGSVAENRGGLSFKLVSTSITVSAGNLSVDGALGYYSRSTGSLSWATGWYYITLACVSNVPSIFVGGILKPLSVVNYAPSASVVNFSDCKIYCPRPLNIMSGAAYQGVADTTLTSGAASFYQGYIQDLRITKGIARYTTDFAVSSGPLPYRSPEYPVRRIHQPNPSHQIARLGL